jgi:PilZ domain
MQTRLDAEGLTARNSDLYTERRAYPRFAVESPATLLLIGHGATVVCRVTELSQDGCRVRARQPFAAGSQVYVELAFRTKGMAFRLGGVSQWSDGRDLMGIRFTELPAWRSADLAEVLSEVKAECLAREAVLARVETAGRMEADSDPGRAAESDPVGGETGAALRPLLVRSGGRQRGEAICGVQVHPENPRTPMRLADGFGRPLENRPGIVDLKASRGWGRPSRLELFRGGCDPRSG